MSSLSRWKVLFPEQSNSYPHHNLCFLSHFFSRVSTTSLCTESQPSSARLTNTGANQCKTCNWIRKAWRGHININTASPALCQYYVANACNVWLFEFLLFLQFAYIAVISAGPGAGGRTHIAAQAVTGASYLVYLGQDNLYITKLGQSRPQHITNEICNPIHINLPAATLCMLNVSSHRLGIKCPLARKSARVCLVNLYRSINKTTWQLWTTFRKESRILTDF